jgi:hypothetical protein
VVKAAMHAIEAAAAMRAKVVMKSPLILGRTRVGAGELGNSPIGELRVIFGR